MTNIQDLRRDSRIMGGSSTRQVSTINRIARHQSATASGDVFAFQNHWRGLGWNTGGYHEVILPDGTVQLCYDDNVITNGIANHNSRTYHICLVGIGSFTEAQEKAFEERARAAMQRLGLGIPVVMGHNEFEGTATACPGIDMNAVRNRLKNASNNSGSTTTGNSNSNSTTNTNSIVDWMRANGMDASFANRARLAKQHGISNYAGTAAQNTRLLKILRGQASTSTPGTKHFPRANSTKGSIVAALNSINVNSSFANRLSIAKANGIKNYAGTAKQNTQMLNLLSQGKLIKP